MTKLTTQIVAAYLGRHVVPVTELTGSIGEVHTALSAAAAPAPALDHGGQKPKVAVKASVTHSCITCLEDGLKFKSLKRHLQVSHGMTPAEYRVKWGLPTDYPMVAPDYAAKRSDLAKEMKLGQMRGRDRK